MFLILQEINFRLVFANYNCNLKIKHEKFKIRRKQMIECILIFKIYKNASLLIAYIIGLCSSWNLLKEVSISLQFNLFTSLPMRRCYHLVVFSQMTSSQLKSLWRVRMLFDSLSRLIPDFGSSLKTALLPLTKILGWFSLDF